MSGTKIHVLNTRPAHQAAELTALLEREGAKVTAVPLIDIEQCANSEQLRSALRELSPDDWLVFTSANAVRAVLTVLPLGGSKIAVVGEKTAQPLRDAGLEPHYIAVQRSALGLASELLGQFDAALRLHAGRLKVLALTAEEPAERLAELLKHPRLAVAEHVVYRNRPAVLNDGCRRELAAFLSPEYPEETARIIALTSAQAARILFRLIQAGRLTGRAGDPAAGPAVAAIGRKTAQTASSLGFRVVICAEQPSMESLVKGICEFCAGGAGRVRLSRSCGPPGEPEAE